MSDENTSSTVDTSPTTPSEPLDPSGIAQFVEHDRCPRHISQRVIPETEADARDWREAFGVMNLALLGHGREFEATQVEALARNATTIIGPDLEDPTSAGVPDITIDETWADTESARRAQLQVTIEAARTLPTTPEQTPYILCYQTPLGGQLGDQDVWGEADCLVLAPTPTTPDEPTEATPPEDATQTTATDETSHDTPPDHATKDAGVVARVLDIKSASEQQPAHRLQVAIYSALLEATLAEGPTPPTRIETSVLTRETAATPGDSLNPLALPTFRRAEWELYAQRLLRDDGPIEEALTTDLDDLPFALDQVCDNCAYREACATRAVEDPTTTQSLAVLGLDATVQGDLGEADITNLRDLTTLHPRLDNPAPTDTPPTLDLDPATRRILEEALPGPIHATVQRAQALRGELDPTYPTTTRPQPIPGNDWVPLPDDRRAGWSNIEAAEAGELIHVTLFVRPDTAIDRIAALGACIHADAHEEYVTIGEVIDAVPDDPTLATRVERDLFEKFLTQLFDAIERVATALGEPERTGLHCYTYSEHEQRALAEGLDRHADALQQAAALRNLLSLHAEGHTDVDQDMCSAVQPILNEHFALQYPAQGLLTVTEQFVPGWTLEALDPLDARPDAPPLRAIFGEQFLNHRVPYLDSDPGIHLHLAREPLGEGPAAAAANTTSDDPSPDGWYPLRRRAGGQFPIEYVWACTPRHPNEETPRLIPDVVKEWALTDDNEPLYRQEIGRFSHRTPAGDEPLQQADVEYLVERLSYALCRLVGAVPYKDLYHEKTPVDATHLDTFKLPATDLASAARDYLRIEHGTRREATRGLYRRSLRERARTGRSIPLRCTDYELDEDGLLTITGELAYDAVFADPDTAQQVASQCRVRTGTGPGGGSWRVLTPLTQTTTASQDAPAADTTPTAGASPSARVSLTTAVEDPETIQHSPPVLIETLDQPAGTITLTAFPHRFRGHGSEFRVDHCGWTSPAGSNCEDPTTPPSERPGYVAGRPPVEIDTGELFVLDPMVDDLGAPKADRALTPETVTENTLYEHLQAAPGSPTLPRTPPAGIQNGVATFLDTLDAHDHLLAPNDAQQRFVRALETPLVALQGPPGTGKTGGATAPALLARAFAHARQELPFAGIVVAPSHEAVDATLAGVVELLSGVRTVTDALEDLQLLRVLPSAPPAPSERVDATTPEVEVTYCNYHADTGSTRLARFAREVLAETATPATAGANTQGLLFATPATLYRTLGIVAETLPAIDGDSAPAAMRHPWGLANVVCLDEASMLDLPRLLLAGSTLAPTGQTLLVGDHRQLPTVTQHDWTDTLREPLEATQAYRSALEYVQGLADGSVGEGATRSDAQSSPGRTQTRLLQFDQSGADDGGAGR